MQIYSKKPVKSTQFQRFMKWCGLWTGLGLFLYWHDLTHPPGYSSRRQVRKWLDWPSTFFKRVEFDLKPKQVDDRAQLRAVHD